MTAPIIVPRSQHRISRRDIDPDALKVLYRLRDANHVAYLVGGSVRDLLLGRRPKDFDVGTTAHPYQIKRLFRNCWIIGRRFRLAHIRFGTKVIEVATFRRSVSPGDPSPVRPPHAAPAPDPALPAAAPPNRRLIERDNTFGTPEEDAFRRDFTINALFYDIATFALIDYVGGLGDLEARVVRSIGDPDERFVEDPVRMIRAFALAARLGFDVDRPILDAVQRQRYEIVRSAPARLLEEYLKILRAGSSAPAFQMLAERGLLERVTPELVDGARSEALWRSLRALDGYRRRFDTFPDALTNAILLGSLMVPAGLVGPHGEATEGRQELRDTLGLLPVPRRDVERIRQILALQPRLLDSRGAARVERHVLDRPAFPEALTWLEIHGARPEIVAHWRELAATRRRSALAVSHAGPLEGHPHRRRRRRRRRRRPRHHGGLKA